MSLLLAVTLASTWVRLTTPRFDVISSAGDRRTREVASDLETLATALADIQPSAAAPPVTRVFLFSRRDEVQPYFDIAMHRQSADINGAFVAANGRATMLIDESRGRLRDRTPYHELVHYLLGTSSSRAPLWVEEGLAEYYSSAEVHGGIIRVGLRIREHMELLKRRKILPVRDLFAVTAGSEAAVSPLFYAESWATVDWLMDRDPRAFRAFLRDATGGMSSAGALQKEFAIGAQEIETILTSNNSLPELPATLQVRVPDIDAETKPMPRADVLYELGRFLLAFDSARSEAERHLRAAVDLNPKHARALAALGEFDRAIAADPNDGEVFLEYAESLLQKQVDLAHARDLAQKALDRGADRARSLRVLDVATRAVNERAALDKINALIKAQKLDEAAALTRTLSANTSDPAARQQLIEQAKQLESEAATNREIEAYNDAVAHFNTLDYRAAEKILDELLRTAQNPNVIADATKLKARIRQALKHR